MRSAHLLAAIAAVIAAPIAAGPVHAQTAGAEPGGAWTVTPRTVALPAARVTLPASAGVTALIRTGEFSKPGTGVDNHAQYESADRKVFATAYVYRAAYADAALAAYGTDAAIRSRFGAAVRVAEQGAVAVAGRPDGAIRSVYDGAVLNGVATTTAAAFVRVDSWIVKLRASGPAERRGEVIGALDALIAGLSVGPGATVLAARPLGFAAPCPASKTRDAKVAKGREAQGQALFGALLGGSAIPSKATDGTPSSLAFPANGATPVCVRGSVSLGGRSVDLLQPAGQTDPGILLSVLNDAGTVVAVEGAIFLGDGFTVKTYGIGEVTTGATLDRLPTARQMEGWFANPDRSPLAGRSRTTFAADGKTTIEVNPAALR
jgi:hypothetical protein